MTTDTVPQTVLFPDLFDKPLFAKFNQEQASSDGGAVLLKAAERVYGLVKAFTRCLSDKRAPEKIRHTLAQPVAKVADPAWPRRDRARTLNGHAPHVVERAAAKAGTIDPLPTAPLAVVRWRAPLHPVRPGNRHRGSRTVAADGYHQEHPATARHACGGRAQPANHRGKGGGMTDDATRREHGVKLLIWRDVSMAVG